MIYINRAATLETLAESKLFEYVQGAFTGPIASRTGKFKAADKGAIFLNEIGELPISLQAKLFQVIQQVEVQRVGADKNILVDVRIIAATNRNLKQEVALGHFRSDLYHRLNVFPIQVPLLREREGDISILIGYFLDKIRLQFNVERLMLHPSVLKSMKISPWPGNVRELEHTLIRDTLTVIQSGGHIITMDVLDSTEHMLPMSESIKDRLLFDNTLSLRESVNDFQKARILDALQQSGGIWAKAAERLKMDRGNLYKLGKKLGIDLREN